MTFSIDIYLAKFLKTNLTKFAVIGREKVSKGRFLGPVQLQITLTKEKDRGKRKIEEEERRRREKAIVALLALRWLLWRCLYCMLLYTSPLLHSSTFTPSNIKIKVIQCIKNLKLKYANTSYKYAI